MKQYFNKIKEYLNNKNVLYLVINILLGIIILGFCTSSNNINDIERLEYRIDSLQNQVNKLEFNFVESLRIQNQLNEKYNNINEYDNKINSNQNEVINQIIKILTSNNNPK